MRLQFSCCLASLGVFVTDLSQLDRRIRYADGSPRRPPSDRAMQILMTVGIAMILSLMVFALSNDIFC